MAKVVGYERLDKMTPHKIVSEQAPLDKVSNERRGANEALSPTTRDSTTDIPARVDVLSCGHRKPPENVFAHLVHKDLACSDRWGASRNSLRNCPTLE